MILRARERPNASSSLWLIDQEGAKPRRLEIGAPLSWAIAPDGRHVAAKTTVDTVTLVPLAGGPSREIRGIGVDLSVTRWSGDGRSLFLARSGGWPCEIHRLDLATEKGRSLCGRVAEGCAGGGCPSALPSHPFRTELTSRLNLTESPRAPYGCRL